VLVYFNVPKFYFYVLVYLTGSPTWDLRVGLSFYVLVYLLLVKMSIVGVLYFFVLVIRYADCQLC
jgi:hypothetical protein